MSENKKMELNMSGLDLDISEDKKIESSYDVVNDDEVLKDITSSTKLKLNAEEKKKLENSKKTKKTKNIITDVDLNYEFNEKDLKLCNELQGSLDSFMADKADLDAGTGIVETLPTGIDLLDAILGGGFGVGKFSMICGNPGTFKSALVAQCIGSSQRKYKGKLMSSYMDSENSMSTDRLAQMGAKYPHIKPYDDVTVESIFRAVECHCAFKELKSLSHIPSIVAWDSIANTITQKEKESDTDNINSIIGLKARILSIVLPKYINKMTNYNVTLLAINQLREKLDMGMFTAAADLKWMGNKTIPGGQALKFNAFHLLMLQVKSDIKTEQFGFSGVELEAKCIKNKLFKPNVPIKLMVNFNTGVSNFWTNYKLLTTYKVMKTGAWNTLITMPEKKFRTNQAEIIYNNNEDGFKDKFDEAVKKTIKLEIIDKYKPKL